MNLLEEADQFGPLFRLVMKAHVQTPENGSFRYWVTKR
jgi:hypothetical protein